MLDVVPGVTDALIGNDRCISLFCWQLHLVECDGDDDAVFVVIHKRAAKPGLNSMPLKMSKAMTMPQY
jgi:hypothetical protein